MIPNITAGGRSFKGVMKYLLHDVDSTETRDRVEWTETNNMFTNDPDKAWKVMAYTAKTQDRLKAASGLARTGRKTEKPVLHMSLSWHPEQDPSKEEMLAASQRAIKVLELQEHEAIIVAHRDTAHKHCHIVVNRIHPITGKVATQSHSKRKLSAFAHQLEMEGGKLYCNRKEFSNMEGNQKSTRYGDPVIQEAWAQSQNGQEFIKHLVQENYYLCQGRKQVVVVDRYGKAHYPPRHLNGVRAREFYKKLSDIDYQSLPDANDIAQQITEHRKSQKSQTIHYDEQMVLHAAEMESRHTGEERKLMEEHSRLINKEANHLKGFYKFDRQKERIKQLEQQCQNPKWWRKLIGLTKRDKKLLGELNQSYQDGQMRYHERMDKLQSDREKALTALQEKQADERADLHKLIRERKPIPEQPVIDYRYQLSRNHRHQENHSRSGPQMRR